MCTFSSTRPKGIFHRTAFHVSQIVHTRPPGVTQTIQAVCTDGPRYKDSPKNPGEGGGGNDALQGGCAPLRGEAGQAPDATQGKGRGEPQPGTLQRGPATVQMQTSESGLLHSNHERHKRKKGCLGPRASVTGATHISLLCISSMRSVKRTSLFLSQKPSAS